MGYLTCSDANKNKGACVYCNVVMCSQIYMYTQTKTSSTLTCKIYFRKCRVAVCSMILAVPRSNGSVSCSSVMPTKLNVEWRLILKF